MRPRSTRSYTYILTSRPEPSVALITLNRPKALNALSSALMTELNQALGEADTSKEVGAIVITGSQTAFAAGADIKEMKDLEFSTAYSTDFIADWARLTQIKKPIIAAVSGYALGGGCELAMMCDIIIASPTAVFGQPEIKLGTIPGSGGTQRLARVIGKSKAMEIVLTGRTFSAAEAEKWGLVSKITSEEEGAVVTESVKMAKQISEYGALAVKAGKELVNAAYELSLQEGIRLERRVFHSLFSTGDQKEGASIQLQEFLRFIFFLGMRAFAEKRKSQFKGE
ncbi:ClpP/crotonase [Cantharellus anzutake]|uniref:ClpP/crotonase n=1 Tax=Cantharellus anzutake TaxID=1750568 RepID=UPI001908B99A|nr:ClpP/crotonase [Cantharellus anzutake]KAF8332599.1 ClpP/crotonase [Cantharellus anzutake]